MTAQTQGALLSDAISREFDADSAYCREVVTIVAATAVAIGDVLKRTSEAEAGDTDQVTVITFGETPDGGTFRVGINGQFTTEQAWNVSTANLTTALNALANVTSGDIVVTGTAGSDYTLTFAANLGGQEVVVQVDDEVTDGGVETSTTVLTTVLGSLPAGGGEWAPLAAAADGKLAAGICIGEVTSSATDREVVCIVRGPVQAKDAGLNFGSGTKAEAIAALNKLGILVRV